MDRTPSIFPSAFACVVIISILVTEVCSQVTWSQTTPNRMPVQFSPLPLMYQNMQQMSQFTRPQSSAKTQSSSQDLLSAFPRASGKLRVLTTLFGGLRNSGLESTIAGEILQRLIKTALRDILVPFKRETFSPLFTS